MSVTFTLTKHSLRCQADAIADTAATLPVLHKVYQGPSMKESCEGKLGLMTFGVVYEKRNSISCDSQMPFLKAFRTIITDGEV
ncbi:hypothetical protein RAB80_001047 [Fusarium oxysporum f. sp. vasinfectum]|nr:hypothetical protein RAB80_001047 [Fusarium oxysporum f. sp. vasinfectum]KAK2937640.1 hypothetical protein FoTM2_000858 [Fusarium oxysporum f. sp. vasinfectum]